LLEFFKTIRYKGTEEDRSALATAGKFVSFGILTEQSLSDCRHIAAALVSGSDILVSWNFKHLVNLKTIRSTRTIAVAGGHKDVIICSPTMLLEIIAEEGANDDN